MNTEFQKPKDASGVPKYTRSQICFTVNIPQRPDIHLPLLIPNSGTEGTNKASVVTNSVMQSAMFNKFQQITRRTTL
jgi:hypothetical protein